MKHEAMWISHDEQKFEHLNLFENNESIVADGIMVHLSSNDSFRIRYKITCNLFWQVQKVEMQRIDEYDNELILNSDGNGHWADDKGNSIEALEGCTDIDIYFSPFTNTLALRRLKLDKDESSVINVVYIIAPELTVEAVQQKYTCLNKSTKGGLYLYESMDSDFKSELPVDSNMLLKEYPKFFRRVGLK